MQLWNKAILGGIASCIPSDSAYYCMFLRSAVCLSVVCHICARCINRSADLDVIWQAHLWGHRIKLGSVNRRKKEIWDRTPSLKMQIENCC